MKSEVFVKLYHVFITFIYNVIFHITLFLCGKKNIANKKFYVSICSIFKDEASFLEEWIEFHRLVGVEHFYLYNNNSSDNFLEILDPYIHQGLVTLIDWPHSQAQLKAYEHFYENYRAETSWVSFLDIDEFICPKHVDTIREWLEEYKRYPVILIYWLMFGTSGKMFHDYNSLVIEQYKVSWDYLYHVGKCLINTSYDIVSFNETVHHSPRVKLKMGVLTLKIPPLNQFKYFVPTNVFFGPKNELQRATIQINHYWSKAWDVYESKRKKSDVFFKENPKKDLSYFYFHENENRTYNLVIYRFLIKLKLVLCNHMIK